MMTDLIFHPVTIVALIVSLATFLGYRLFLALRLQDDYKHCEMIIKKNSKTFYKAFSAIRNRRKRNAVYAVYAFCRKADDLIDENQDPDGLDALEDALARFVQGEKIDDVIFRALSDVRRLYGKDYLFKPYFEMIEGQRMDFKHQGYQTLDDLLKYCYHVASTVGRMLVPILAPRSKDVLMTFADELGYAMQLTNILRDVGEDQRNNRIYLPQDLMARHQVTKADLAEGRITQGFINLFEELAGHAERYYDKSLENLHLFPFDARIPLGLSIILYRGILDAIRASDYDVFTKKNYVSDAQKKALIEQFRQTQKRRTSI